ncbi:extracellular solute-binding protein [Hwanghaeella sp.]|uniref:extracellular solute-binding protein n=1 Tax=Hwanghaeella sp. TaxID=2605943 RepID=UPI003CCB73F2
MTEKKFDNISEDTAFKRDLGEIAMAKFRDGKIDRRSVLGLLGALGVIPIMGNDAFAAPSELVLVNWGGKAAEYLQEIMGDTYTEKTGIKTVVDGSGPSAGKIRAMVESGAVVWDVCDSGPGSAIIMGKQGVAQPIDYSIVDKSKVIDGFTWEHGVANYTYSYSLCCNPTMLDAVPETWADVWNVKDFPGKRTFRKSVRGMLETAAMAMGAAPADVYEFLGDKAGIKAAVEKFREIREHVIVWPSGSMSQQLFLQKEVSIGCIWSTRAHLLKDEMPEGSFTSSFNGGVLSPGAWVVPVNNPAGADEAMKFLAHTQDPDLQIKWLDAMGVGPANPAAADKVPESLKKWNPSSPENLATQTVYNDAWYAENQVWAEELYVDALIN